MSQELFIAGLVIENSPLPPCDKQSIKQWNISTAQEKATRLPLAWFGRRGKPLSVNGAPAYAPKQDYIIVGI